MATIAQTGTHTFQTSARGNDYTLTKEGERWVMYVVNAAVRAWNRGYATPKYFESLEAVEAKYKVWKGIAALCGSAGFSH